MTPASWPSRATTRCCWVTTCAARPVSRGSAAGGVTDVEALVVTAIGSVWTAQAVDAANAPAATGASRAATGHRPREDILDLVIVVTLALIGCLVVV